jgi:hypothetical protein
LAFVLCFISVFAIAQVPMAVGGPQGITVTRINAQDWMAVPIMADTPVAPLTGTGWPGRGYIVFVARPDSACNPLPATCPPRDTSLWEYTGQRWKRVGMDYLTRLVFGGQVTQTQVARRNFIIDPYSAFINGSFYRRVSPTFLTSAQKTADSTSRIDVIVITRTGPVIRTGVPNVRPNKPVVNGDEIELTTIFFPANDTVPSATSSTNFVSSIFRIAGRDSIYYTQNNQTYAIKDSIGISKNDTASMLNPYKFTAANGLTKDSTVFRLGGSLNQNTDINLNNRRLSFIRTAGDTSLRITTQGRLLLNTTDTTSNHIFYSNGRSRILSLEVTQGENAGRTGQGIRIDGADRTFGFQGSGSPTDMFKYSTWVNDTTTVGLGSSPTVARNIISIYTGFSKLISCGASSDTTRANVLNIAPRYVFNCDSSRNLVRGIYYNPSIVNINRTNHIAYENTTGTNLLNSVSGSTRIGYNTFDTTYKLDVNGNTRVTGYLDLQPSFNNSTAVIRNQGSSDGSIMFVGQGSVVSSTPPARNVIIDPVTRNYTTLTGNSNTLIGRSTSATLTSGNQNIFVGLNAGNGVTTGNNNVIILNNNGPAVQSNTSLSIVLSALIGDSALFGLTDRYSYIGAGSATSNYINDFYFGGGHRVRFPNTANLNFYAPSAWPTKADTIGSDFTINAGRGSGTGLGGSVIFRTSSPTTSGTTLQTLSERARITPSGNLLVGTATDVPSSKLTVTSTTQGFLPPRMTGAQAELISSPAEGLMIYSTDGSGTTITSKGWWGYDGSTWVKLN